MYNIVSYFSFLSICFYVTIMVGWRFYKIGEVYLIHLLKDETICKPINNILLVGYYLVNLGYIAYNLSNWKKCYTVLDVISLLTHKVGFIFLVLGILHFTNISIIYLLRKNQNLTFKK